jgi:hypothetical protein
MRAGGAKNKKSLGTKMNTCSTRARLGACSFLLATICSLGHAQTSNFEYRASLGAGHTDNIGRDDTNPTDETLAIAGLRFSFDAASRRTSADVVGALAYHDYLDDTFDAEFLGNLRADTAFALVPERFVWVLNDQFGQAPVDPFQPASPDNRQNINILTTGPDGYIGLGAQTRLRMSGRYSLSTYEVDPLDSTITAGELGLIRNLSDRSSVSINGRAQQTEYDDETLDADFDQRDLYLRYQAEGARTNIAIDAGYSELDRDAADSAEGGARFNLDLSRRISDSSILELSAARRFATAASEFASGGGIGNVGLGTTPGRQTADPFTLDEVGLSWTFRRSRTTFTTLGNWSRRDYEGIPTLNQKMRTFGLRVSRDLSPTTSLDLNASFGSADYADPSPDYDEKVAGLGFRWHLTRNLVLEAAYDFFGRDEDQTQASITENRFLVTLGWGRGEPRSGRLTPRFGVDPAPAQGN